MKKRRLFAYGFLAISISILAIQGAINGRVSAAVPVEGKTTYIQNNQVWLSNANGSGAVQLTNDAAAYNAPVLSPNKSKIAVERTEGDQDSRIYIINTDGTGSPTLLSPYYVDYTGLGGDMTYVGRQLRPQWNPASTRVAFYTVEFAQPEGNPYFVYDAPLGGAGTLYRNGINPVYSPDGLSLAYMFSNLVGATQNWQINTVTVSPAAIIFKVLFKSSTYLGLISWSSDGTRLAIEQSTGEGTADIILLSSTTIHELQNPVVIHDTVYTYLAQPTWSSDDTKIAMVGTKTTGETDVLLYTIASSGINALTQVNSANSDFSFPLWSTDDTYILTNYSDSEEAPNQLVILDVETGASTDVVQVNYGTGANRDVKDWQSLYQAPQVTVPQVLGTSTTSEQQSTTNTASNTETPKQAVLGATTLPSTGLQKDVFNILPIILLSLGVVCLISSRLYARHL